MNQFQIECEDKPVQLVVKLNVKRPLVVRLMAYNPNKPNTFYTNRIKPLNVGVSQFEVRMPQNCKDVILRVIAERGNNSDFIVDSVKKVKLDQFSNCYSTPKIQSFVKFAQEFCENASILSTGKYYSDDKKYQIEYLDNITEKGRVLSTPARISNIDGRMQVSKSQFIRYTVPMRMAILLHEFSHFYQNVERTDEIEADLNALRIYLGLGYPVIEAHNSFLNVFKRTPTEQNKERYQYIKAFIDNFDKMKYRICL